MIAIYIIVGLTVIFIAFPTKSIRFIVRMFGKLLFKTKIEGTENIPKKSGALLIANHVSFLDFILIAIAVPRMVRFVMYRDIYEKKYLRWILKKMNMIPISPRGGANNLDDFNKLCQDEINAGHVVVIFAEGTVTRNGHLLEFKRGLEHIAEGIEAPIIPIHMEGVIGTPLSFAIHNKKATAFKPKFLRKKVFINIGKPMPAQSTAFQVRQKIQEINAETLYNRIEVHNQLAEHLLKLKGERVLFVNDLGDKLTAEDLRKRVITAAIRLKKMVKSHDKIGVLLENNFNMLICICALNLIGKTPVLLNLDFSDDQLKEIIHEFGDIPYIVNGKKQKLDIKNTLDSNILFNKQGKLRKAIALFLKTIPNSTALFFLGNKVNKMSDAICIPNFEKGGLQIENIIHQNLIGQTYSLKQVHNISNYGFLLNLNNHNSSISFITNLILPIIAKTKSVIYNNHKSICPPIEYCNTIIGNTNQVEELYKNFQLENWDNVKYIITTNQTFSPEIQKALTEKLNISIFKGMGKIGIAPIITINTPDYEGKDIAGKLLKQQANDDSSVGRPLPGLAIKVIHPDNEKIEMGANEIGRIFLKGILLSQTEKSAPEWMNSEMIGSVDEKGFLTVV